MSETPSQADSSESTPDEKSPSGVFGNLPSERPGSRSPRRDGRSGSKQASPPAKRAARRPSQPPLAASEPGQATPAAEKPTPAQPPAKERVEGEQIAGIEDLAWAGVTVAAQAATVGVKLASRALKAVRNSVERP